MELLAVWRHNKPNQNVILTRQTCGQRSGMAAGSKRRALAFYFFVLICYMFFISKCRREWDPGLCMALELVNRMTLRTGEFWRILRPNRFKNRKSALRSGILFANPKSCTDLVATTLYISIFGTCSKFVLKNKILPLGAFTSRSHARAPAAGLPRQDHVWITDNNFFLSFFGFEDPT